MDPEHEAFLADVEQRGDLADQADADDATTAVLSALGERLDETRSQRLAGDLPRAVADPLTDGPSGRDRSYEEFLDAVEERADRVDAGDPEGVARAVVATLLERVDDDERANLVDRLADYGYEELTAGVDAESGVDV